MGLKDNDSRQGNLFDDQRDKHESSGFLVPLQWKQWCEIEALRIATLHLKPLLAECGASEDVLKRYKFTPSDLCGFVIAHIRNQRTMLKSNQREIERLRAEAESSRAEILESFIEAVLHKVK